MSLLPRIESDALHGSVYPQDFWQSRARFRWGAEELGLERTEIEISPSPGAEPVSMPPQAADDPRLTMDVARRFLGDAYPTMVLTSGLHGAEGFLGGAVQWACFEQWSRKGLPADCNIVLVHGLNPHGFAQVRRFDSANIDPNRNFLLPGQRFEGAAPLYRRLNGFLNPARPDRFPLSYWPRAAGLMIRHGYKPISAAIAQGQYEYPRGLFFGGDGPGETFRAIELHLDQWLSGNEPVIHLDFHTGLGPFGQLNFLMEQSLTPRQIDWLNRGFGEARVQRVEQGRHLYEAKGSFGEWCVDRHANREYIFMCAEVGTYPAWKMLAGLREENNLTNECRVTNQWNDPRLGRLRRRMKELFCPASESWRSGVLTQCLSAVDHAVLAMPQLASTSSQR